MLVVISTNPHIDHSAVAHCKHRLQSQHTFIHQQVSGISPFQQWLEVLLITPKSQFCSTRQIFAYTTLYYKLKFDFAFTMASEWDLYAPAQVCLGLK